MRAPYLTPIGLRSMALLRRDIWWTLPAGFQREHPRRVALTFDDGPGPDFMLDVLRVLQKEGVRATFFLLGDRCALHPEVVQAAARGQHGLALHGDTHYSFTSRASEPVAERLQRNRKALENALGDHPAWLQPYFRPPFGFIHEDQVEAALRMEPSPGFQAVNCSILPGDSTLPLTTPGWFEDPEITAERVAEELEPGAIIALHCGQRIERESPQAHDNEGIYNMSQAGETARRVIRAIRANGYEPGPLP